MYFILNFILQNIVNILCAMTVSFCLTPKYSRIRSLTVLAIINLLIYAFKFSMFDSEIVLLVSSFLLQAAFLLFILLTFKDSIFKKLVCFSIIILCNVMAEYIGLLTLDALASYNFALDPDTKEFFLAILLALPVQIILNLVFLFFWKHAIYRNNTVTLLAFSLIPMVQILINTTIFVPSVLNEKTKNTPLVTVCSLIALFAIIVLLYYLLRRQEKQSLEADYLELQELYRMESEYYETLENRNEELAKIRHDYNNLLAALYVLISSGRIEAAKEMAASLKDALKD